MDCLQKYLRFNGEVGYDQLYPVSTGEGNIMYEDVFQQRKRYAAFMF